MSRHLGDDKHIISQLQGGQMASTKEILARSELFKRLTNEELEKVAGLGRQEIYPEEFTIFSESAMTGDLYIVDAGKVAVEMKLSVYPGLVQQATVEVVLEGDAFGWSAVLGSPIYSFSAKSVEPVRLVAIDGERLHSLLDENPDMGYRVMSALVEVVSSSMRSVKRTLLA